MFRGGEAAARSPGGGAAKAGCIDRGMAGTSMNSGARSAFGFAWREDRAVACGKGYLQQSCRQSALAPWCAIGQSTTIGQRGAQGTLAATMVQVSPASAGCVASTATTITATNWRNLFICFEKTTIALSGRPVSCITGSRSVLTSTPSALPPAPACPICASPGWWRSAWPVRSRGRG